MGSDSIDALVFLAIKLWGFLLCEDNYNVSLCYGRVHRIDVLNNEMEEALSKKM